MRPLSININSPELLKTLLVGTFFPVRMCDRLCFWFLCEYQQLLEISRANHVTVHVVGQSERQLSPLTLMINKKLKKIDPITGFVRTCSQMAIFMYTQGNFKIY